MIGIELTSNSIRAVKTGHGPERTVEVPLTPDRTLAGLLAEVRTALDHHDHDRVALAAPSGWFLYRAAAFPYRRAGRIESTLAYSLEGRLPGNVSDYVIEPLAAPHPAGSGARLPVAACPAERMRELLASCGKGGWEPCVVQPAVAAVARRIAAKRPSGENLLLVRCDPDLDMAFLRGGKVAAVDVPPAGDDSAEALAARVLLAARCHQLSDDAAKFDRALLLASESRSDALRSALETALGCPVEVLAEPESRWAAARGAAEAARRPHDAVNLRRGEFAYAPHARRLERRVAASLILSLGILCALGVHTARRIHATRRHTADVQRMQERVFRDATGLHSAPALAKLEGALATARKEATQSERDRLASCLSRWVELMKLVPQKVTIDTADLNQKRIAVTARAADKTDLWKFRDELARSERFVPGRTSSAQDGSGAFTMEITYK